MAVVVFDDFTGIDGSAPNVTNWSVTNTTGSSSTILSNALTMVTGATGSYNDKTFLTWTGPFAADVEIDLDITPATINESYFEFDLRATNSGGSLNQNGYRFEVAFNGFVSIIRNDNFVSTTLASGVQVVGFGAGVTVHVQASASGGVLTLYAWTGSSQPPTPTLQTIDTTWRDAGYVGFYVLNGNAASSTSWTIDNATISTTTVTGAARARDLWPGRGPRRHVGGGRFRRTTLTTDSTLRTDWIVTVDDSAGLADVQALAVGRVVPVDSVGLVDALALTVGRTVTDLVGLGDSSLVGPVTAARGLNNSDGSYNVKPDGVWGTFPGTYGSEWHYDASASITYLASRGIKFTRLPIAWERIQPTRGAALDTAEVARITTYLDNCQTAGIRVIIEPHAYARYREGAYPTPGITLRILGIDLPVADIADLWARVPIAFGSHPAVYGWELMNEPFDLLGRVDSGATFGATFDTNASGWTTANGTMTRSTTTVRTGAGSLQVTASGAGDLNALSAFTVGGGSPTFSAYVRSNGAARSAQFDVDWWDSSRSYISSTSGGFISSTSTSWQLVTWTATPPAGAVWGDLVLQVLSPLAGEVFYWDDVTSNTNGSLTQATLWEDASQRCVTAIRNTGDAHRVYVPGYNWQDPRSWRVSHPDPFVTDPAGKVTYSAHFYFDDTDDGTYAATYAQENTNAIGEGYSSVTDRTVSSINKFVAWCTDFGVTGAFTELGWPHNADATSWNTTADAVYTRLDQLNADAWVWVTGEFYGTTSVLTPYDTGGGATLSAANAQAPIIEAHLGVAPPVTVTVSDSVGLVDSTAVAISRQVSDFTGTVDASGLTVGRAVTDSAGIVDDQTLILGRAVSDDAGFVDVQSLSFGRQIDDPIGVVDTAIPNVGRVLTDSTGTGDSTILALGRQISDPAGLVDSALLIMAWIRTVDEPAGLSDNFVVVVQWARQVDDSTGAADDEALIVGRTIVDDAGLTDLVQPVKSGSATFILTDPVGLVDGQAFDLARVVTDPVGLVDTFTAGLVVLRQLDDSGGFADGQALTVGHVLSDDVGLFDASAVVAQWLRQVDDSAGFTDLQALAMGRQVADMIGLVDAQALSYGRQVDDVAGVTDATVLLAQWVRTVNDSAGFNDSFTASHGASLVVLDLISLTDAIDLFVGPAESPVRVTVAIATVTANYIADTGVIANYYSDADAL